MDAKTVIQEASKVVAGMGDHKFLQLMVNKPTSQFEALNMVKITSKISSLVGNLFEIDAAEKLRSHRTLGKLGTWIRQDPDFPDVLLKWDQPITPGFEVKAWYPMSTEITGRFKDSQSAFINDATHVVLFAWLPEKLLWGNPKILKIAVVSGRSIAAARDNHYHNPPDYLVIEPRDTSKRTRNLQQRNTSGYKWQDGELAEAVKTVESWGEDGAVYKPTKEYQTKLQQLRNKFSYRLDTNYGKMDRVIEEGVENFKADVLKTEIEGRTVMQWIRTFKKPALAKPVLAESFGINS